MLYLRQMVIRAARLHFELKISNVFSTRVIQAFPPRESNHASQ